MGQPMKIKGFPDSSAGKESTRNAGDLGSIPGLGRSPGEGKGYPLQYSGLENSMNCIGHRVTKSQTWLSDFHFTFSSTHSRITSWFCSINGISYPPRSRLPFSFASDLAFLLPPSAFWLFSYRIPLRFFLKDPTKPHTVFAQQWAFHKCEIREQRASGTFSPLSLLCPWASISALDQLTARLSVSW